MVLHQLADNDLLWSFNQSGADLTWIKELLKDPYTFVINNSGSAYKIHFPSEPPVVQFDYPDPELSSATNYTLFGFDYTNLITVVCPSFPLMLLDQMDLAQRGAALSVPPQTVQVAILADSNIAVCHMTPANEQSATKAEDANSNVAMILSYPQLLPWWTNQQALQVSIVSENSNDISLNANTDISVNFAFMNKYTFLYEPDIEPSTGSETQDGSNSDSVLCVKSVGTYVATGTSSYNVTLSSSAQIKWEMPASTGT